MRIIPAIDVLDGKCVRLQQGAYDTQKVYSDDPVAMAQIFEAHGIRYLHLVDLDGARTANKHNIKVLESIARSTNLHIDFGGGMRDRQSLQTAFDAGAAQVTLGSMAIRQPELFLECLQTFGGEKIILGADCRRRKIAIDAWTHSTDVDVLQLLQHYEAKGLHYSVITDVEKDGMLAGPALALYKELTAATKVGLIASGGISCNDDLHALKAAGCVGAIIGKAIYENTISLKTLGEYAEETNYPLS